MARYIDIELLPPKKYAYTGIDESDGYALGFNDCLDEVLDMPTADVKPVVHAHWVYIGDKDEVFTHKCSNCGSKRQWAIVTDMYVNGQYCGRCGAKMDEEVKDG